MTNINPKLERFFSKEQPWQKEMNKLRSIVLSCGLQEEMKWGQPCYTHEGKNLIIIHGFKEYCALLFFKGALMSDTQGILIQQTGNVQSGRQIRFTDIKQINQLESSLKKYIYEAVEVEKSGLKVEMKKTEEYEVVEEFTRKLAEMPALKAAFEALTPGRRRAYLLHFSQSKQSKTRESRVEKCIPMILEGKGLND